LLKANRFGDLRRSTLSWCRRTRISACNAARDRNSPIKAHQINLQRSLIGSEYQPIRGPGQPFWVCSRDSGRLRHFPPRRGSLAIAPDLPWSKHGPCAECVRQARSRIRRRCWRCSEHHSSRPVRPFTRHTSGAACPQRSEAVAALELFLVQQFDCARDNLLLVPVNTFEGNCNPTLSIEDVNLDAVPIH
jgi:hypothetical protein